MNLPNRLTVMRIIMIPVIILIAIFPYSQFGIEIPLLQFGFVTLSAVNIVMLVLFCVASFTDFLDGYLARKNNLVTTFGKFADPIADKLLVTTCLLYTSLVLIGRVVEQQAAAAGVIASAADADDLAGLVVH